MCAHRWYHFLESRIRRGHHVFVTWVGDHAPKHVHVFRAGKLVLTWDLERWRPMAGRPARQVLTDLRARRKEGRP